MLVLWVGMVNLVRGGSPDEVPGWRQAEDIRDQSSNNGASDG